MLECTSPQQQATIPQPIIEYVKKHTINDRIRVIYPVSVDSTNKIYVVVMQAKKARELTGCPKIILFDNDIPRYAKGVELDKLWIYSTPQYIPKNGDEIYCLNIGD